ncbi:MAG: tetratricopeptide repeat protein [Actinobacteria bacterium]|nr:tetratricopeptide repeat protein [Actinomycetota bacterium]
MRKRLALAGTVAALAATVLLAGGALRNSGEPAAAGPLVAGPTGDRLEAGFAAGDTAGLIRSLQDKLRSEPDDSRSFTLLGLAYQQRARETGSADFYSRSDRALRRSLALAPRDPLTLGALGSLALARHDFRRALALGRRAQRLAPYSARNYGVVGDALIELGRYEQAFRTFDRMAELKPSLGAYARVSYARELLGRPRAAEQAMNLALDATGGQPEPTAWTHTELGKLAFAQGQVGKAGRHFRAALRAFPGYAFALDGLARVEAADGHLERGVALASQATEQTPLPQFVATLGDLQLAAGRQREARDQFALVGAIEQLLRANGVRTDLEIALFNVDHGRRLRQSLVSARRAHRERPSIEADDVLAWALTRNGHCQEALGYSRRALRLGSLDASKFFHRGMIERCLGRSDAARGWFARAIDTNPHFSLVWAPVARRYAS